MICPMCGRSSNQTKVRLYQYDNGEVTRMSVCPNCADTHDHLINTN